MTQKVIRIALLLLSFLVFHSCVSKKMQFGRRTEISASKDSAHALKKISVIKNLDYSDFQEGSFSDQDISLRYRFLKPKETMKGKKHPLILVFHGSGAIGEDNKSQMGVLSKMWLLPKNRKNYPTFVLSPQFPARSSNYFLDAQRGVQVSYSNKYLDLLLKSVDSLSKTENIDASRIYVMGFSMGGATTMNAVSRKPDLFAAAVNISGISQFTSKDALQNTPIWIVHGSLDTDNYPQSNFKFFEETKSTGRIFLWEYKDKYHNNILSADLIDQLPKWLFKQNKINKNNEF